MIRSGLVSVTFRKLSPEQIIELVAQAGVDAIEWGGDVHVPHGDTARAKQVREWTLNVGLRVASYGSYYRVGVGGNPAFSQVLETACALGAPTVRVWAGNRSSADADAAYTQRIAAESKRIAEEAEAVGVAVAYEYHTGTLTDTTQSALALVEAVGSPNMLSYWQPLRGLDQEGRIASLKAVSPYLANLHVHWPGDAGLEPLEAGRAEWSELLMVAAGASPRERFALVEFVKGDTPEQFLSDAATLKAMIE